MFKKVIKEVIIVLLLCLAVMLLLGVLLYEYIPMTKVVPNAVAYTEPAIVKEELSENSEIDKSQIVLTYTIDEADLSNYERVKDYKPGKANPFSSFVTSSGKVDTNSTSGSNGGNTTSDGSTSSNGSSSSNNNSSSNNGSSSNNNSNSNGDSTSNSTSGGGTFFQNKGTK